MNFHPKGSPRQLVIVLGDQLNGDSAGVDGFDAEKTPGGLEINA